MLEPIFPVEDNIDKKPPPKKRANKKPALVDEQRKVKVEEDSVSEDCKQVTTNKKAKIIKKTKPDPVEDSLEEVMKDLSSLITNNTKQEVVEETIPVEVVQKPKKYSKKQLDALKRRLLKKENLENTLKKIDLSGSNVIDMLDLNVRKFVRKPVKKRRHSIEKYPLETFGTPTIAQLTIFNNLPRSISPKMKRSLKIRQSVDHLSRRSSPYTTRSDSPARILRNGKHRKLRDFHLLEGLDLQFKRRRRLCSDFSGSELSVSKVSGYDSDSSFSDMSSLHGTESSDVKEIETKKEDADGEVFVKTDDTFQAVIKSNISNEPSKNGISENTDSNSNVCNDIKTTTAGTPFLKDQKESQGDNHSKQDATVKIDSTDSFEDIAVSPSLKVPEKSIILNSMKQTFNYSDSTANNNSEESNSDKEKRATRASTRKNVKESTMTAAKFYGNSEAMTPFENVVKDEVVPEKGNQSLEEEKSVQDTETTEIKQEQPAIVESVESGEMPTRNIEANFIEEMEISDVKDEMQEGDLKKIEIFETPENLAIKENILQALGLQSLKAAEQAKMKEKERWTRHDSSSYTGTLKTVIKINRCEKKKGKNSLKMTLQKNKSKSCDADATKSESDSGYKIMKEVSKAGSGA